MALSEDDKRWLESKFMAADSNFAAVDSKLAAVDSKLTAVNENFVAIEQKFAPLATREDVFDSETRLLTEFHK